MTYTCLTCHTPLAPHIVKMWGDFRYFDYPAWKCPKCGQVFYAEIKRDPDEFWSADRLRQRAARRTSEEATR